MVAKQSTMAQIDIANRMNNTYCTVQQLPAKHAYRCMCSLMDSPREAAEMVGAKNLCGSLRIETSALSSQLGRVREPQVVDSCVSDSTYGQGSGNKLVFRQASASEQITRASEGSERLCT